MTERYQVSDSLVYIELDDKDPEAKSDYAIDFAAVLDPGTELMGTPVVEIEAAGNGESPVEMDSADISIVAPLEPVGSPPLNTVVLFWLTGGTSGCRYRGKIKCDATTVGSSPSPTRTVIKRFYIVARLT